MVKVQVYRREHLRYVEEWTAVEKDILSACLPSAPGVDIDKIIMNMLNKTPLRHGKYYPPVWQGYEWKAERVHL